MVALLGLASAMLMVQPDVSAEGSPQKVMQTKDSEQAPASVGVPGEKVLTFSVAVRHLFRKEGFPELGGKSDEENARNLRISGLTFSKLVKTCAPDLSEATAYVLAKELSDLHPWSVGVIGGSVIASDSPKGAFVLLDALHKKGKSVSIGLFQLSETVLRTMGVTAEDAIDPCRNISLFSDFLMSRYRENIQQHGLPFLAAACALEDFRLTGGRSTLRIHSSLADSLDTKPAEETAEVVKAEIGVVQPEDGEKPSSSFVILAGGKNPESQEDSSDREGSAGETEKSSASQVSEPSGKEKPRRFIKATTDTDMPAKADTDSRNQDMNQSFAGVVKRTQPNNHEEEKARAKEKNKQNAGSSKNIFQTGVKDSSGRPQPSSLGSPRVEEPEDPTTEDSFISKVPSFFSTNSKTVKVF